MLPTQSIPGIGTAANPFSVHRVEPGAIPFVGEGEASLDAILCRLMVMGFDGQITGPHGSGKTTLLVHLERRAAALGWVTSMFRAQREPIVWPKVGESRGMFPLACARGSIDSTSAQDGASCASKRTPHSMVPRVMFIDSAEQMPRWKWVWLRRQASLRGVGVVVTTHRDLGLPLLHTRHVDGECAHRIVDSLIAQGSGASDAGAEVVVCDDLEGLLAVSGGSLRDVLFTLYDRYEGRAKL